MRGHKKLLWICGGPGKGKTMMSIYLTEKLEKDQRAVYYFCRADDEQHRSAAYVLRSLLWQLTSQQPDVAENLLQHLHKPEKDKNQEVQKLRSTLDNREALWVLLVNITKDVRFRSTFCVVDGLDECDKDSQQWLAEKLVDLGVASTESNQLRVVLVSRPTVITLRKCSQIKLDPDNDGNLSTDLRKFVSEKMKALSEDLEFDDNFRAEVESTLLDRADGTFLWVGFVMIELRRMKSQTEVETALKTLPKDLSALYDRMLLEIRDEHRKASASILQWLVLAVRPLSLAELGAVIHCSGSRSISSNQSTQDRLAACGSLVRVDNGIAGLVHESARDYLLRDKPSSDRILESFRIVPPQAHLEIARTCLAAIERNSQYFRDRARDSKPLPKPQGPVLDYAVMGWPDHARQARQYQDELIGSSPTFFEKRSQLRLDWCETVLAWNPRWELRDTEGFSEPLSVACFLGIEAWCCQLLGTRWSLSTWRVLNRKNKRGLRPLYYAARWGRIDTMRLLVERGAKVNNIREGDKSALRGAVECNNLEAVRWLLELGANSNAMCPTDRLPLLHKVVRERNQAMLRLLLEHGADANVSWYLGPPLHWAIRERNIDAIRLLLDHGADIDAGPHIKAKYNPYNPEMTPLHLAISEGQIVATRLLLDRGANVELRDRSSTTSSATPLWTAIALSEQKDFAEEVSILLLSKGAKVDATYDHGNTLLHQLAARPLQQQGTEFRVRLLLDHGASATIQNVNGSTPLHISAAVNLNCHNEHASSNGTGTLERIARLLLEHGADPAIEDNEMRTPLEIAIVREHHGLLQVLRAPSNHQTSW